MKTLTLRRTRSGDTGTFGQMMVDGVPFHTGELPWRDNARGLSCIPAGSYICHRQWSPKFKRDQYFVLDVPSRTVIELHVGNWCGDTTKGLKSDVDGCILLGLGFAESLSGQPAVTASNAAIEGFESIMGGEDFRLDILDEYLEAGAPAPMA